MPDEHEVVIVGAGPAGSALAYFLARAGRDVLLIDKVGFPRDKTCGDVLTPRALSVLRSMGLLDQVAQAGFRINGLHMYAPDGRRVSAPIPACRDLPEFMVVLPRFTLDHLILQHALQAGARFQPHLEANDVLRSGERIVGVAVRGPDGPRNLHARTVVLAIGAATGLLERASLMAAPAQFGRSARGYYEAIGQLDDHIEFHMESVPLPGYGWVFPTSPTSANVGAGYFVGRGEKNYRNSPRQVLDEFLANPIMAQRMAGSALNGPIKGYPVRFDFPTAALAYPGLLLIGEAAGMVNPLTGEGIDYALESAEVAAECLLETAPVEQSTARSALAYTRAMHGRFLKPFLTICRMRDLYFRPWLINRAAGAALRHADFRQTLVQVFLGNIDPAQGMTPRMLLQIARG